MESSVEFQQSFNPLLERAISGYQGMARSTAINDTYRKTINRFVSRAMMDDEHQNLPSAMRSAIRELTEQGIKTVDYTSGHASRMDSAVRNAMTTEFTQIVQEVQRKLGEELGTDGVEISAHEHCAVDHEPLQGHTFTNEEYEKLQNGDAAEDIEGEAFQIDRPIGMWNCRHIAFPVIIGVSESSFSPEELEEIKERNEAGIEYHGEHYTLYEAEQEQRRIETQIRHEKERLELLKELKDTDPLIQAEYNRTRRRLAELRGEYKELGAVLEPMAIRMKADRASVTRKKLISDGYILADNRNIHISLSVDDIMEIEKNAHSIEGRPWGSAIKGNEKAEAFAYVNSSVYRPLNYATDGLHENYQNNILRENLEIAIGQRIHAQEQIKSVIASRDDLPYFLRGEELPREVFDKMIADKERDLTGITALTASRTHNDNWIRDMLDDDENYVTVRFHFLRDDVLERTVGLVSQNDLDNSNMDRAYPDEVAIGATKFFIDRVQEGTFEGFTIYDIYGKVKR